MMAGGAVSGGAVSGGAVSGGAVSGGAVSGGAASGGVTAGGAKAAGAQAASAIAAGARASLAGSAVVLVADLPETPLAAAAAFYARILPGLPQAATDQPLTLVFPPADHTHRGWRAEAVASLARDAAPRRVNALASDDDAAIAAAAAWLATAPGITGQLLQLDSNGAGPVIG